MDEVLHLKKNKLFLQKRLYLRLKILSLFYPYGFFLIEEDDENTPDKNKFENWSIPNQEASNTFRFLSKISLSLIKPTEKSQEDFSYSPFSIAIGYWHSKSYNFIDSSDIAIALSNQYLNFIKTIIIPEQK